MTRSILLTAFVATAAFTSLFPRTPPKAPTQAAALGFDPARLARMSKVMQGFVDRKELPGLVLLVARDGKVVEHRALGTQDLAGSQPMRPDTIFRIASMSKAVTSVAVMILFEEGRLGLDDPLSKFIPEFKGAQVAIAGKAGEAPKLVKASREITVRDLLTHRSGISYGFIGDGFVQQAYRKLGVSDGLDAGITLAESMARLARAPLVHDPGKAWHYGLSTDVLGRVVEVVSGQSLDVFLQTRIFRPLKMPDTGFTVPSDKQSRLAEVSTGAADGGIRPMKDPEDFGFVHLAPGAIRTPGPKYLSGGAGLAATASDYARFCQMLLNRGALDGARILSPKTVDLMTASATHDLPPIDSGFEFGLGVGLLVDLGAAERLGTPGSFSWSGIYGTSFFVDPKERLVVVLMTQRFPFGDLDWSGAFRTQVYQALVR